VSGQPVEVCSAEDAIWDIMQGKAVMLEGTGKMCRSPSMEVEIPSVIQQTRYHKPKHAHGTRPRSLPLTPRNVCARDRHICAYQRPGLCQGRATTVDHVIPKAQGGPNTWENVVAACRACNHKKGNRTPAEMGWEINGRVWSPEMQQWRPTGALARVLVHANQDNWTKYLFKGVQQ